MDGAKTSVVLYVSKFIGGVVSASLVRDRGSDIRANGDAHVEHSMVVSYSAYTTMTIALRRVMHMPLKTQERR